MAKIYISSTYNDLVEYRDTVYKSLRKMGHDVIAMEDYVASDNRPVDKCLIDVSKCNIYVGIFAWRYGFIPKDETASITELEYRYAKNQNIPCLIFLLDEKTSWPPSLMDSHTGDGDAGKRINSLRNDLKNEKVLSFFDEKVDLAVEVAIAVYRHEKENGLEHKPPLWEYLLTIDLLKAGLGSINKQYSDLSRGLIYRPYKTINNLEIIEWVRQKLDDLIALIALLKLSATEELMSAWGKLGQSGDEEKIHDATTKILNGCNGLLEWEIDLTFTRFPSKFENVKKTMQGWAYEYVKVVNHLYENIENVVSIPDAKGTFQVSLVFEAPENINEIVSELQRILDI